MTFNGIMDSELGHVCEQKPEFFLEKQRFHALRSIQTWNEENREREGEKKIDDNREKARKIELLFHVSLYAPKTASFSFHS